MGAMDEEDPPSGTSENRPPDMNTRDTTTVHPSPSSTPPLAARGKRKQRSNDQAPAKNKTTSSTVPMEDEDKETPQSTSAYGDALLIGRDDVHHVSRAQRRSVGTEASEAVAMDTEVQETLAVIVTSPQSEPTNKSYTVTDDGDEI